MPLSRRLLLAITIFSFGAVGAALFSQHVLGLMPCAWCVLQRLIFIAIGVVALLGMIGTCRHWTVLMAFASLALSATGMWAAWHQWTVAAQSFSCDQTLADRLMTSSGLESGIPWLFGIYATCMDAAVSILGLEFAVWSLLLYAALGLTSAAVWLISYRWQRSLG